MSWQRCDELCVIMPLLIVCSYVDQRDMEIPDLPLALIFIYIGLSGRSPHPLAMIIMAIIVIPFVFTKKIGMGDCKMMDLMVLYAGIRAAIGFVIACVLCITVQLAKKESPDQRIPFGPYLCIGFLFTLLSAG
jgi:prepilin signal peptidase PulO-like enzyme (type II secretory pathway)